MNKIKHFHPSPPTSSLSLSIHLCHSPSRSRPIKRQQLIACIRESRSSSARAGGEERRREWRREGESWRNGGKLASLVFHFFANVLPEQYLFISLLEGNAFKIPSFFEPPVSLKTELTHPYGKSSIGASCRVRAEVLFQSGGGKVAVVAFFPHFRDGVSGWRRHVQPGPDQGASRRVELSNCWRHRRARSCPRAERQRSPSVLKIRGRKYLKPGNKHSLNTHPLTYQKHLKKKKNHQAVFESL